MADGKKIQIIHAADADQHLGHLKKILDTFKEEDRIESYSTIPSDAVAQDAFNTIGKEDMLIMLLTNDILDKKPSIEAMMLDVKKRQPEARCAGVIIDNITYDPSFIAFPSSLEPVRTSEDMDAVWQGIAENLKKLFPKLVVPIVPPPPPPNDDTKTKPWWKKWLPYIFGVVALLAIFFTLKECFNPPATNEIIAKASVVAPRSVQGNCPHKFNFTGTIKVDGPMTVKYTWVKSNGTSDPVRAITFNAAGEKQVKTSWTLGSNYSGYQQLKIVSPKELLSNKAAFRLQCASPPTDYVYYEQWESVSAGTNGWVGPTASTSVGIRTTGGNPGRYLLSSRNAGGSMDIGISYGGSQIPKSFVEKRIKKLTFDLKLIYGNFDEVFFRVRYKNSTRNGWKIPVRVNTSYRNWRRYSVSFDPNWSDARARSAGWIQEPQSASFKNTMSEVYQPQIKISGNGNLRAGFDNLRLE